MKVEIPPDKDHDKTWTGEILTYTGLRFDVMNPRADLINIQDIAHSLSMICRYNGHVRSFYSVAEHSIHVANWLSQGGESPEVQLAGLMHDSSEAYVGDMVSPLKRTEELGTAHTVIEERVLAAIAKRHGFIYPLPDVVHEADKAVYAWEVNHVRLFSENEWRTMLPTEAKNAFGVLFNNLQGDMQRKMSEQNGDDGE